MKSKTLRLTILHTTKKKTIATELQRMDNKLMANDMTELQIHSVAFSHNGHIPPRYTCEGENINPSLEVSNVPDETKTLALIMEDPDAPNGTFDHWVVWNILPNEAIAEQSDPGIS